MSKLLAEIRRPALNATLQEVHTNQVGLGPAVWLETMSISSPTGPDLMPIQPATLQSIGSLRASPGKTLVEQHLIQIDICAG